MVSVSLYTGIAASTGGGVDSRHRIDIDDVGIAVTERLPAGVYIDCESTFDRHVNYPALRRSPTGGSLVEGGAFPQRFRPCPHAWTRRDLRCSRVIPAEQRT